MGGEPRKVVVLGCVRVEGGEDSLQVLIDGGADGQTDSCSPGEGGHNRRNASHQACGSRMND